MVRLQQDPVLCQLCQRHKKMSDMLSAKSSVNRFVEKIKRETLSRTVRRDSTERVGCCRRGVERHLMEYDLALPTRTQVHKSDHPSLRSGFDFSPQREPTGNYYRNARNGFGWSWIAWALPISL